MKIIFKYLIPAALAVMTLAGCSGSDDQPQAPSVYSYPEFNATIGSQSRAHGQSWEEGDQIGITGCGKTNVCYVTTDNSGNFTAENPDDRIYFQSDSEVEFTAYYPWTTLTGGVTTLTENTEDQTRQNRFDFLWAKAKGSKSIPKVTFNFDHCMTKLSLIVKPGTGVTFDEVKSAVLSLSGFRTSGTFNIGDGTTTTTGDAGTLVFSDATLINSDYVRVNEGESIITYTLLFFPQSFSDKSLELLASLNISDGNSLNLKAAIDFTAANSLKDTNARNEWVAGRQYNLSVTLNRTDFTVSDCVIKGWDEVNGGEFSVD